MSKWIPVTERVPQNSDYVLVSFEEPIVPAVGYYIDDDFIIDEKPSAKLEVTVNAWMPLPDSYKEPRKKMKDEIEILKTIRFMNLCDKMAEENWTDRQHIMLLNLFEAVTIGCEYKCVGCTMFNAEKKECLSEKGVVKPCEDE